MNLGFFLLLFLTISITNASKPEKFIFGGYPAKLGQFPHQVSIQIDKKHSCGGAILNSRWIITAQHCIRPSFFTRGSILVGSINLLDKGTRFEISTVINYEDGYTHDVSLVKVNKEISFNENVKPIEIYKDEIEAQKHVIVSGWGKTESSNNPNILMYTELLTMSNDDCYSKWIILKHELKPYEICTTSPFGVGTCNGDSGGPLIYKNKLIGLVAFGKPCAIGYPDVFMRLSYYKDWIDNHIKT